MRCYGAESRGTHRSGMRCNPDCGVANVRASGPLAATKLPELIALAKARSGAIALRTAPDYALGPVKNYINFTDGGLAVDERLQVLDERGQPVPGLFAAGSTGQGGLLLKGHGHHLGWAFTSGRLAGMYAAGGDATIGLVKARPAREPAGVS
ncbi:MAG: FAD-binding protein [Betaproteobacteria bacterium]|nr:FAD-binding protein [Betaproteobacteria bacterium]